MPSKKTPVKVCTEVRVPDDLAMEAANKAIAEFPPNAPMRAVATPAGRIAVIASKWWGARAKELTVGFMEPTATDLRDRILSHANAWSDFAGVRFVWTKQSPVVRISFGRGGYYSYLGTDNLSIPAGQHTMNLEGFTMRTSESEYRRVVRHEFGHALGCPHEQQRREVLRRLDEQKTIAYFMRTQGWSEQEVRQQILVPLEEDSLMHPSPGDVDSIMCYQFPGSITKDGKPIPGGSDFSTADREYFAKSYPKTDAPTPTPPGPGGSSLPAVLVALDPAGKELARYDRQ